MNTHLPVDFLFLVSDGRRFCSQGQLLLVVNLNFLLQSIDVRFQLLGHGFFHLLGELMVRNLLVKLQERNPAQQAETRF
jgi:hypothetical protein